MQATPSDNHFMAKGYHYTYPGDDPTLAAPVEALRVKSVITRPFEGATLALEPRAVKTKPPPARPTLTSHR